MENVQVYVALAIIGVTIILFATEAFKTSITAILSSLAMVLVGINTPKNLTSGFSNSAMLFCFCTQISKDGDIWTDKTGYRSDIKETVSAKRGRNHRSQSVPRPYTHADKHPSPIQCITDHGVFEREK